MLQIRSIDHADIREDAKYLLASVLQGRIILKSIKLIIELIFYESFGYDTAAVGWMPGTEKPRPSPAGVSVVETGGPDQLPYLNGRMRAFQ